METLAASSVTHDTASTSSWDGSSKGLCWQFAEAFLVIAAQIAEGGRLHQVCLLHVLHSLNQNAIAAETSEVEDEVFSSSESPRGGRAGHQGGNALRGELSRCGTFDELCKSWICPDIREGARWLKGQFLQ
eukprot:488784-Amphidinium_carterae.1